MHIIVVAAAYSFIDSHIYPPVGMLTMLAFAVGWTWLAYVVYSRRPTDR